MPFKPSDEISDEDREYFQTDSKRFFERALLNSKTWEEGVKYAKELRNLQHPSLSAVQSRSENITAIELRWSRPSELRSNELASSLPQEKVVVNFIDNPIDETRGGEDGWKED